MEYRLRTYRMQLSDLRKSLMVLFGANDGAIHIHAQLSPIAPLQKNDQPSRLRNGSPQEVNMNYATEWVMDAAVIHDCTFFLPKEVISERKRPCMYPAGYSPCMCHTPSLSKKKCIASIFTVLGRVNIHLEGYTKFSRLLYARSRFLTVRALHSLT
jgi:hypothetical protein